jgi:serine/threonine-protein kinase
LWWQAADGSGNPERLTTSENSQAPSSVSVDGAELIFGEVTRATGTHLMRLSLRGTQLVTPLLQSRFNAWNGELSSDSHWLAYESDSSGQLEIYVRPYPETGGGQWQVSTEGGSQPAWARRGNELFYLARDGSLMSVRVEAAGRTWRAAAPVKLFQGSYSTRGGVPVRMYDVLPDAQRFLMLKPAGSDQNAAAPSIVIVHNFGEELKARVPTK